MRKLKNGFTIAEMLICLVVAGALAAMLIPSIVHKKPDKNKAMFRKAYYIAERVVAELTMDEDDFPAEGDGPKGFAYYDQSLPAGAAFPARTRANTAKYLCDQFAKKISTNGNIRCTTAKSADVDGTAMAENNLSFTTNDGIAWVMTVGPICDPDFEAGCTMPAASVAPCSLAAGASARPYACVLLDVNGSEGPNKRVYIGNGNASNDVKEADRAWMYIYYNGKVQIPPGQAARYLKSTSVF